MSAYALDKLFRPESVALIGASEKSATVGAALTQHLLNGAFAGPVYLVNPAHTMVFGRPCLRSIRAAARAPDLAIVATPWSQVRPVLKELADCGCKVAVVVSIATTAGWFGGSEASEIQRCADLAQELGIRVVGPSSQGVLLPVSALNGTLLPSVPPAGRLAVIAQSGAIVGTISAWAETQSVGLSAAIALGDAADVDVADCLDYLARDNGTDAVLLHLGNLGNARRFLSAARDCAFRKPVIALKPGPSAGERDARVPDAAHDLFWSAALGRAGVMRVRSLSELYAATHAEFARWPEIGPRFAIVTNGEALAALASDALSQYGAELAQLSTPTRRALRRMLDQQHEVDNPLDLKRDASPTRIAETAALLSADPEVDSVLIAHQSTAFSDARATAAALVSGKSGPAPMIAVWAGGAHVDARRLLASANIPGFESPEAALGAWSVHRRYRRLKDRLRATPPPIIDAPSGDHVAAADLLSQRARGSSHTRLAQLLALYGTDLKISGAAAPDNVQHQIGVHHCPTFGPVLYARHDTALAVDLPPLDRGRAERLLDRGWKGGEVDSDMRAQCVRLVLTLAEICARQERLRALWLSGLRRNVDGEIVARGGVAVALSGARAPLAILPCPNDLDETITLTDGRTLLLRPIRAEDELALQRGFTKLSPEEVRLRFMFPLKALTHDLAAKLTQIDYAREMALVLADFAAPGHAELFGVVRACLDPATRRAEYAIVIPKELSGQGLGSRLLRRISAWSRAQGMVEIWGDVLAENAPMLHVCKKLGFSHESAPHDPGVVRVRLAL